jgi:hypothetical protein
MFTKSKTEREAPRRAKPNTENADPMRSKLRNDKELPKCRKSSTDNEEPSRAKVLKEMVDPM